MNWKDDGIIWKARQRGFANYYPAVPDFDSQRRRTAAAAKAWLDAAPENCKECEAGTAHSHPTPENKTE